MLLLSLSLILQLKFSPMKKTFLFNKMIFGLAVIAIGLLSSCNNEEKEENSEPVDAATIMNQQNSGDETAQVNPKHGLPGHRCDIPVGAPLNSTPNMKATPAPVSSSTVSPVRIDQTPKVNPPHGEPGHDCTVPVGAKLTQN